MKNQKKVLKITLIVAAAAIALLIGVVVLVNSGNPLIGAKVNEYTVKSGSGQSIGTYAVIKLSDDEFNKLSPEYYAEYAKSTVDGSGYNWYTVASDSGKGAVWNGSNIDVLTIGTLDSNYCIAEQDKILTINGDTYE